jgi:hypothetical protein
MFFEMLKYIYIYIVYYVLENVGRGGEEGDKNKSKSLYLRNTLH